MITKAERRQRLKMQETRRGEADDRGEDEKNKHKCAKKKKARLEYSLVAKEARSRFILFFSPYIRPVA